MSGLIALLTLKTLAMVLAVLWGIATCAAGLVPQVRRGGVLWALAALGVPVLGGLTYLWGPGLGVGAFALGVVTLRLSAGGRQPPREGVPAE